MRLSAILTVVPLALALSNTSKIFANSYKARLPGQTSFAGADLEGHVQGYVAGSPQGHLSSVVWTIYLYNLPKEGGPFSYHVHEKQVVNGNCTTAGRVHDARHIGEKTRCDPGYHLSCRVGDLSGKHGVIDSDPFEVTYTDYDTSIFMFESRFFGDKSVVIHYANETPLACANFVRQSIVLKPNGTITDTVDAPTMGPYNGNATTTSRISLALLCGGLVTLVMALAL